MGTVTVNNTSLEYTDQGSGENLVFVHGSASDHRTWQAQQEVFAKHYRVISYSRRYHWPNQLIEDGLDYSMSEHIEDLTGLLDALKAKPAHIIGHSYGALMALSLATEQPHYVQSLVLAEPPVLGLFVKHSNAPNPAELLKLLFTKPRTGLAVIKLGVTGLGPAAKAAKKGDMNEVMRLFGRAALGQEIFNHLPTKRKEQVLANLSAAEFLGSGFLPLDARQLRQIKIPVLLLTGQKSPRVFHHLARQLQDCIPHMKRREILGASHIMHEDNVLNYNTAVLSFLEHA